MSFGTYDTNTLILNLQAGVVVHAPDTAIHYANPKALELLRLTENQVVGKDIFDPQWRLIDKYRNIIPPENYPVYQVLKSKTALLDYQLGVCDSNSEAVTWINCCAYPQLDEQGDVQNVIIIFIDITSQQQPIPFEEIVALAKDIILVTEADTIDQPGPRILYANEAFYELSGYTPEETFGKTPRILQGPKTDRKALNKIKEALKEQTFVRETLLNYAKDGRESWLDINLYPLSNEYGKVTHFVAMERDITQSRQNEEQLKQANKFKSELAGIVAHDLRNPLATAMGVTELLQDPALPEDEKDELLDALHNTLENMDLIIKDLMTAQKLDSANMELNLEKVSAAAIIDEVVDLNQPNAVKKSIQFTVEVSEDADICIDHHKLLRALNNLVNNAVKFSPQGSTITVGIRDVQDTQLTLFVSDQGPGLTEKDKTKVFSSFAKLSARPTGGEHSTGLGLSIVKKITELHQGTVGVDSEHGKGSTFYIKIPRKITQTTPSSNPKD